jgi:hypothetical protein
MKIKLDCLHAHQLAVKSMDVRLAWHERIRLRLHLFVCDMCTSFVQEMAMLRQSMRLWGRDED